MARCDPTSQPAAVAPAYAPRPALPRRFGTAAGVAYGPLSLRRHVWLTRRQRVAALRVAALVCVTGKAWADDGSDSTSVPTAVSLLTVWAVASALVLFGIAFKRMQRWALERVPTYGQPIIATMFQELTLLGGLGLILFACDQMEFLSAISREVFGEDQPEKLPTMVRAVDMLLVAVVFMFLISIVALVLATRRIESKWQALETEARLAGALLVTYDRVLMEHKARRKASRCYAVASFLHERALCCCKSRIQKLQDQVVHASLRARFIRPPVLVTGKTDDGATSMAVLLATGAKEAKVDLKVDGGRLYRHKNSVFAFKAKGPVKFYSYGEVTEGNAGDWVIAGEDGDVFVVSNAEFTQTYIPVPEENGRYRKVMHVLAKAMQRPYLANTVSGFRFGKPGTYLIQEVKPQTGNQCFQSWLSPEQFRNTYEPVDPTPQELINEDTMDNLPVDFDFAMYLSALLGHVVASIVHIGWYTWASMHAIITLLCLAHLGMTYSQFRIFVIVIGYCVPLLCFLMLRKLTSIQAMLTVSEAVERLRGGDDDEVYNALADAADDVTNVVTVSKAMSPKRDGGLVPSQSAVFNLTRDGTLITSFRVGPRVSLSPKVGNGSPLQLANATPTRGVRRRSRDMLDGRGATGLATHPGLIPTGSERKAGAEAVKAGLVVDAASDMTRYQAVTVPSPAGEENDDSSDGNSSNADTFAELRVRTEAAPVPRPAFAGAAEYMNSVRGMVESGRVNSIKRNTLEGAEVASKIEAANNLWKRKNVTALGKLRKAAKKVIMLNAFSRVQKALAKAPFERLEFNPRGTCACCPARWVGPLGLCAPRNKQEQMFWFGSRGKMFLVLCIQGVLFLTALYIALGGYLLISRNGFCSDSSVAAHGGLKCGMLVGVVLLPPVLVCFMVPTIAALLTTVSNVELMKKRVTARNVVHTQYTAQGIRALRMLSAMVLSAAMGAESQDLHVGQRRKRRPRRASLVVRQLTTMYSDESPLAPHGPKKPDTTVAVAPDDSPALSDVRPPASGADSTSPDDPAQPRDTPKNLSKNVSGAAQELAAAYRRASVAGNAPHMQPGLVERVYGAPTSGRFQRRKREVRDVFNVFDRQFKGYIECKDVIAMLGTLHIRGVRPGAVEAMLVEIDADRNGRVDFEEFHKWIAFQDAQADRLSDDALTRFMFKCVNSENSGSISVYGLRHALCCLGMLARYEDTARLVAKYDASETGTLNYAEFRKMVSEINKFNEFAM